jgi:D-3-phosphoglycerate dehydrogenase
MSKVIITDHGFASADPERSVLEPAGICLEEIKPDCRTEDDIITHCQEADALIVQFAPVTRKVLEALPKVKCLVRYGVGVNNLDLDAARDLGVLVANVPDYCVEEVSDHALAMALSLCRELPQNHSWLVQKGWGLATPCGIRSFGETEFGLVGFGRIARRVAQKAKALGSAVKAYDPLAPEAAFTELGVQRVDLPTLLSASDIISFHCPLTPETTHLVNAQTLATMRRGVLLINTSRGPVIDEPALVEALQSGQVGGAGLDVFEQEPLPAESPLRGMANVILTSHVASASEKAWLMLQTKAAEAAREFLLGRKPAAIVVDVP